MKMKMCCCLFRSSWGQEGSPHIKGILRWVPINSNSVVLLIIRSLSLSISSSCPLFVCLEWKVPKVSLDYRLECIDNYLDLSLLILLVGPREFPFHFHKIQKPITCDLRFRSNAQRDHRRRTATSRSSSCQRIIRFWPYLNRVYCCSYFTLNLTTAVVLLLYLSTDPFNAIQCTGWQATGGDLALGDHFT